MPMDQVGAIKGKGGGREGRRDGGSDKRRRVDIDILSYCLLSFPIFPKQPKAALALANTFVHQQAFVV